MQCPYSQAQGARTAKIVKERIRKSKLKTENFNWKKAIIYIMTNKGLVKTIHKKIRKFAPIQKSNKGTTTGMSSKGLNIEQGRENKQWYFPRENPNEEKLKEMIGTVVEIAIIILWKTYCYDFGGKTYIQKEGGPIGQRTTMAAS